MEVTACDAQAPTWTAGAGGVTPASLRARWRSSLRPDSEQPEPATGSEHTPPGHHDLRACKLSSNTSEPEASSESSALQTGSAVPRKPTPRLRRRAARAVTGTSRSTLGPSPQPELCSAFRVRAAASESSCCPCTRLPRSCAQATCSGSNAGWSNPNCYSYQRTAASLRESRASEPVCFIGPCIWILRRTLRLQLGHAWDLASLD